MDRCIFFSLKMRVIEAFEKCNYLPDDTVFPEYFNLQQHHSVNLKSRTEHLDGFTPQAV